MKAKTDHKRINKGKKELEHCTGCFSRDPLGATHQKNTIEHEPQKPVQGSTKVKKYIMVPTDFAAKAKHREFIWKVGKKLGIKIVSPTPIVGGVSRRLSNKAAHRKAFTQPNKAVTVPSGAGVFAPTSSSINHKHIPSLWEGDTFCSVCGKDEKEWEKDKPTGINKRKKEIRPYPKGEKIADYVWLDKTQRSWHIWAGNPFCIGLYRSPLTETEEEIIKRCRKIQAKEKKRFTKLFPDIKWESI